MTLLVVMGSGETAPAMVKTHRDVLRRTPDGPALMLDTPFAFQDNAADLTARTRSYFADSVGRTVEVAHWSRADAPAAEQERALSALASASWVFAGPGSPTYALRQWIGTSLPGALTDVAERGGTLVLGSAAAVTVGTHAIPVYEIYKVGEDPRWVPGLDLLGSLTGIRAVVVPHYDNAEGGSYDTRFCYLGERRLARLERELPDDVGVLGVDEHTGLIVDVAAGTAEVTGSGGVTVRRRGTSRVLPAGTSVPIADLAALLSGAAPANDAVPESAAAPGPAPQESDDRASAPSLRAETDRARTSFDAALEARDAAAAAAAVLALEGAITAWSADTLQGDDRDRARRALRAMVVRLGDLATDGVRDPREALAPYLQLLLELRGQARAARDFATSDLVRDRLLTAGVTVQDTPDGPTWSLA